MYVSRYVVYIHRVHAPLFIYIYIFTSGVMYLLTTYISDYVVCSVRSTVLENAAATHQAHRFAQGVSGQLPPRSASGMKVRPGGSQRPCLGRSRLPYQGWNYIGTHLGDLRTWVRIRTNTYNGTTLDYLHTHAYMLKIPRNLLLSVSHPRYHISHGLAHRAILGSGYITRRDL